MRYKQLFETTDEIKANEKVLNGWVLIETKNDSGRFNNNRPIYVLGIPK
jgi:hypothetical protein